MAALAGSEDVNPAINDPVLSVGFRSQDSRVSSSPSPQSGPLFASSWLIILSCTPHNSSIRGVLTPSERTLISCITTPQVGSSTSAFLPRECAHPSRCTHRISASLAVRAVKRRSPDLNWRVARNRTEASGAEPMALTPRSHRRFALAVISTGVFRR